TENIDPLAGRTRYTYDARDNLTTVTDPTGSTTRYAYDLANRRTQETRPGGEQTQFVYDAVGNLITRRDSLGQERRYAYDEIKRRSREEHYPVVDGQLATSASRVITYSYNPLGQLTAYRDAKPLPGDTWQLLSEATYTHDALGRKVSEDVNFGPFRKTFTTAYRANGQKQSLTYPDGTSVSFNYDSTGRLTTHQTPGGDITTTYHPSGAVSEVKLPGATQSRVYDKLLRPTQIQLERGAAGSGQVLHKLAYQYDAASDIVSKTTLDGPTAYQYDALSRLTSVTPPEPLQRSETNPSGLPVESYSYDGVHNRLSSTHQPGPWVYNANHQLLNHGEGTQAVSRTYDANGHTTRIAESAAEKRLSYDVAERLTQVQSESGTPIGAYAYDPFGRRLKKTTASETIYFHHGEEGLLAEFDATGNSLTTYGWEPQGMWGTSPVWKKEGSNTYFYSTDHLGTPQVLTDSSGQVVWKGRAEAFGKTTVDATSTVTNNLRFPGQYFDAETGMHYNYFRDYEPSIGRYVESDPIGLRGGANTYVYGNGNAATRVDVLGLMVEICARPLDGPMFPPELNGLLISCRLFHTYLRVNGNDFGFFCSGSRCPFWGDGSVRGPNVENPSNPMCTRLDCINEQVLMRNIQADIANPPRYELWGFNCQRWAGDQLARAFDPTECSKSCRAP
ncbi:MAG: RHS repeat protein, partial [Burkholderiales bacterium]